MHGSIPKKFYKLPLQTLLYLLISLSFIYGSEIEKDFSWKDGLDLRSNTGNYTAHIDLRAQTRYSNVNFDEDFDYSDAQSSTLRFNRVRFKMGGKLGTDQLKYYGEYDFVKSVLLDLWIAPRINDSLHFRIGQYKVPYNRERFDSSGKQLFAERSIITPPFTLDRQVGITVMGRLFKGEAIDSSYFTGIFIGNGRASKWAGSHTPMVFGRWQWNIFQQVLPFSRSDISRHEKPTASLAVAAASNRSAYTKFSTSGGTQLPGFQPGTAEQYDIKQMMAEFALMYRGFSVQCEYHWKYIDDRENLTESNFSGFYFDTGYFFSESIAWVPEPLEFIARFAKLDNDSSINKQKSKEMALGANWYFYGHRNKLTLDITRKTSTFDHGEEDQWGTRFQWDISF